MGDDLKQQTKRSIVWNAIDKVGFQFVALVVGLITARCLSPNDFGLMGALAIFTALSNILVESGFTSAMVRRANNTDAEYMAVFFFNLLLSLVIYGLLYVSAPFISAYFNMPELLWLSRFLFLAVIFNSVGIVQTIVLTKQLEFKVLSLSSLLSALFSGGITLVLIYFDFGYWALAAQILMQVGFKSLFLWLLSSWKPVSSADFRVIKELFDFSFSLILSSVLVTVVKYVYNLVIGHNFQRQDLGYYSQAFKFHQIPSNVVSGTISGVAYPVLSTLNDDESKQLSYFRKLIRVTAFCIFPVMLGLFVAFDNLVSIILTDKWLPIVPYFRILCVAAILFPLHSMNVSLNTIKGFPKRSFAIEMVRNALVLVSLLFCLDSITSMLVSFSLTYLVAYFISAFYVSRILPYTIFAQVKDVLPYAAVSVLMAVIMDFVPQIGLGLYPTAALQLVLGGLFYCSALYILGSKVFNDVLEVMKKK